MEKPTRKLRKDAKDRSALLAAFEKYVTENDVPIIAEFAYRNRVTREHLYRWPAFKDAIKLCTAKKESALERGLLEGRFNAAGAIFSLKQLGWTDRHDLLHKGDKDAPIPLILKGSDVRG